jgi:hypothetical protein
MAEGMKIHAVKGGVKANVMRPSGQVFIFRAQGLTRERTGIHGKVSVLQGDRILTSGRINLERIEQRDILIRKSQSKQGISEIYPRPEMEDDILNFCEGAWGAHTDSMKATMVVGDSMGNPIEWLAKPHILQGGGTILFAPGKHGKSYTAMVMAVATDAGLNGFWQTVKSKVMYINLERSAASIVRRLGCVNTALGLDPSRGMLVMNARGKSLLDIRDSIERSVEAEGVKVGILDSISRAGMGDLNENKPVNIIADAMNSIFETWVGIAHTPRGDSSHIYGSVMFENAADVIVQLKSERQGSTLGVGLDVKAGNDIEQPPQMYLRYEFDEWGLKSVENARLADFPRMEEESISTESLPAATQMFNVLKRGKIRISDLYAALPDINEQTIRSALTRRKEFIHLGDGEWGVVSEGETAVVAPLLQAKQS